jgi:hypothetical protein
MRLKIIAAVLFCASVGAFGQSLRVTGLSQLPDGTLSGNAYSNDALGVIFHFPAGWTANLDSGHSVSFGKDPDGPANRCTRILLRFQAPRKIKGWFIAWGILFAIDPACLGVGPFPVSADPKNAAQINDFAEKIFGLYHPAPFFPPGGFDVFANRDEARNGPVIVYLEGKGYRNIDETDPSIKKTPVSVSTLFSLTKAPQLWVGWAEMDDDRSKADMTRKAQIEVKVN